ncbi:MAG TPA: peptidoglycan DD-metalloendopeptidase family protein [Anaerolineae bacterium]|nr:peptidoglycan DD-metalloendopeptidase family protein [Anaerolineae bacterium]
MAISQKSLRSNTHLRENRAESLFDLSLPKTFDNRVAHSIAIIATRLWQTTTAGLVTRYTAHLTVLVVVIAAIALGRPAIAAPAVNNTNKVLTSSVETSSDSSLQETFAEHGLFVDSNIVSRLPNAHTTVPFRTRREIVIYRVQPGDNVQGIAAAFGLQPETILWSNPAIEDLPDLLKIDQEVVILPIDGVYHEVKTGDTLDGIAKLYKVDVANITDVPWNNLTPPNYDITAGSKLIVKDGTKPFIPKVVTSYSGPVPTGAQGSGQFRWPVVGYITQDFWAGHKALDISAPTGSPVYASDAGYVSFSGWTDVGYGWLVRINHGNGFETLYAHNSQLLVVAGEAVARGQLIAYAGSTGHSTGPHCHFEIRLNGVPVNPRLYLP